MSSISPFIFVIFGGDGNLSKKKLIPALYTLFKLQGLNEKSIILFHSLNPLEKIEMNNFIKNSLESFGTLQEEQYPLDRFLNKFINFSGDFNSPENFTHLNSLLCNIQDTLKEKWQIIFYLSIPPEFILPCLKIIEKIKYCENNEDKKLVIEKPFGNNLASAKFLNKELSKFFSEKEIYRIDHYLGKETVQNILFFRFGNSIFEPLWSREYVDHVEITISETIGIEKRGLFYEKNGILKDIIQNHALQLLALVAMEYPPNFQSDSIRDEKIKVFKSIKRFLTPEQIDENIILGQYDSGIVQGERVLSYREEENVESHSNTPTFFGGKFEIESWRWSGVPFYIRAGKRLKKKVTEIAIFFKNPPLNLFGKSCSQIAPNKIIFSIQPEEKIEIFVNMKYPGDKNYPHPIKLAFDYSSLENRLNLTAYERLILDIFKGDQSLFARQDGIELMWDIIDPLVSHFSNKFLDFPNYSSGTWGPKQRWNLYED